MTLPLFMVKFGLPNHTGGITMAYTNKQLSRAFFDVAGRPDRARNALGSMSYDACRARSYRTTMARIVVPSWDLAPFVLLNRAHYSTTTRRHQLFYAHGAHFAKVRPIYVFNFGPAPAHELIDELDINGIIFSIQEKEKAVLRKADRARLEEVQSQYYKEARELRAMAGVLRDYQADVLQGFGDRCK